MREEKISWLQIMLYFIIKKIKKSIALEMPYDKTAVI
jgi:hypothetical protein